MRNFRFGLDIRKDPELTHNVLISRDTISMSFLKKKFFFFWNCQFALSYSISTTSLFFPDILLSSFLPAANYRCNKCSVLFAFFPSPIVYYTDYHLSCSCFRRFWSHTHKRRKMARGKWGEKKCIFFAERKEKHWILLTCFWISGPFFFLFF